MAITECHSALILTRAWRRDVRIEALLMADPSPHEREGELFKCDQTLKFVDSK